MKISAIGPIPVNWGGGSGWRGGGIASHVQGVLPHLPDNDISVHFLADNSEASKSFTFPNLHPGVKFVPVVRSPLRLFATNFTENLFIVRRMLQTAELRASLPGQFLRFWGQAINYGRFLNRYPYQLLHIHQAFNRQFLCQSVLGSRGPIVVTAHSVNALLEPHPKWTEQMILTNYRKADWFIAVSNFVKEKIVDYGANSERVTIIPNGVDPEKFLPGSHIQAREKFQLPLESFLFLYCGNLIKRKGVDVLIKAFSRSLQERPDMLLVIIGDGSQRQELEQLAKECGVHEKVLFGGYKNFDEIPVWYQACDAFVLPSWAEGLSMSILESMASGRPVITTRPQIGEHDAIDPNKTGLLTNYGDVEQLTQALLLLATSDELVSKMSVEARRVAVQKFKWANIAQQTADVFRHVLEMKSRS